MPTTNVLLVPYAVAEAREQAAQASRERQAQQLAEARVEARRAREEAAECRGKLAAMEQKAKVPSEQKPDMKGPDDRDGSETVVN